MKKILSVLIAVIMSVSVMAVAFSAFAVESPTAAPEKEITITVNGGDTSDVKYTFDDTELPYVATFEYTGPGRLIGWEENMESLGFVLGVDYRKEVDANGKLTIYFLTEDAGEAFKNGDVEVNAIVEFDGTTGTTKPNSSPTSPDTGIATSVIAGSIAVAGAGIAVLSATKKKDAE